MFAKGTSVARASLAVLALTMVVGHQSTAATGLGGVLGGVLGGGIAGGGIVGNALNAVPNMMNSAANIVTGAMQPVSNVMGTMTGGLANGVGGLLSSSLGGVGTLTGGENGIVGNSIRLATGAIGGVTSGIGNGIGGFTNANSGNSISRVEAAAQPSSLGSLAAASAMAPAAIIGGTGLSSALGAIGGPILGSNMMLRNNYKREAIADSAIAGVASAAGDILAAGAAAPAALVGAVAGSAAEAGTETGLIPGAGVAGALAAGAATGAALSQGPLVAGAAGLLGRQALASEAIRNAQVDSANAGAEMVQNGAINARSASMASNAYRQAKLAGARDRVNIAGTIQNSARISDAAIATHDTATKAEDSLLGSELAVDSAATVFDSDGAYIPPVTASLLRSLPYGRLGLRNIIPKPLTHPSTLLPDVWLNGVPVNYQNIPLRMLPYGIGPAQSLETFRFLQAASANGAIINSQPYIANNGMVLNGLVFDPAFAYRTGYNMNGIIGSSLIPILANGQLEAQDEIALANLVNMQQLNGQGMGGTYQGYGRLNPVPMITGSVSDINLTPTTIVGTTYPIGSALVIEPRDSYFQDYTDNASSRQNMDERQQ